MSNLHKVYLPKWMTWFTLAMIVPIWAWITYQALIVGPDDGGVGAGAWVVTTVILAVVSVVMVLMGQRKLPAYLLEVGEDDEE